MSIAYTMPDPCYYGSHSWLHTGETGLITQTAVMILDNNQVNIYLLNIGA